MNKAMNKELVVAPALDGCVAPVPERVHTSAFCRTIERISMKEQPTRSWRSQTLIPRGANLTIRVAVLAALMLLVGCHKKNTIGLDVDVYLHPEAAAPDDQLLQTAIQKQINQDGVTKNSLIHVRVVDRIVFLTGTVRTQAEKQKANEIAQGISITVNEVAIKSPEVRDHIVVEQ